MNTQVSKKAKAGPKPAPLRFVESTHEAIQSHLQSVQELPTFLSSQSGSLTLQHRRTIVRQARVLMEENFVHLPLKVSMHGINPVQQLSLLEHKLAHIDSDEMGTEYSFHREMLEIFTSIRDLHTNYLLPEPFSEHIAFMPFSVEKYYENDEPGYIATHLVEGFTHPYFKQGVEILYWNGVPIQRAIEVAAHQHAGSNAAARHARGVDGLTLRALKSTLPPDENWVIVGFRDSEGAEREMKQEWIVSSLLPRSKAIDADILSEVSASQGLDIDADIQQQARKMLFAPQVIADEQQAEEGTGKKRLQTKPVRAGGKLTSVLAGVFRARSVKTTHGTYGYIRIYTFNVPDPTEFINEFIRLISLLPKTGLIIDVRGNGGGHIMASEGLLQTLTPYEITPEPTQFINTPLNASICGIHRQKPAGIDLGPWYASIRDAIATGAIYSRAFPITPPEFANAWGQQYHGPVVLITDARCYSATDIFAAGFQDHEIGTILGVDNNTGAGGANVWTHTLLRRLANYKNAKPHPYESLPKNAGMRVSIRRTLRVGARAGTPVEDIGVTPDKHHKMTRQDLLQGNVDLINQAAEILKDKPRRQLDIHVVVNEASIDIEATTKGLDRLDIYIDDRPMDSELIADGQQNLIVRLPKDSARLVVAGYINGDFVAVRNYALT